MLAALNDALLTDPAADGRFCTALYGMLEIAADGTAAVTLAGGGHPPALHLTPGPDARARPVELPGGTLTGVLGNPRFVTADVRLAPGSGLLLYTDGLTGARTRGRNLLGQDGLAAFLHSKCDGGPVDRADAHADSLPLQDAEVFHNQCLTLRRRDSRFPQGHQEESMIEKLHDAGLRSEHAYLAGLASIGLSFAAWATSLKAEKAGRDRADRWGIFVGHWAPTLFGLGNALRAYEK